MRGSYGSIGVLGASLLLSGCRDKTGQQDLCKESVDFSVYANCEGMKEVQEGARIRCETLRTESKEKAMSACMTASNGRSTVCTTIDGKEYLCK